MYTIKDKFVEMCQMISGDSGEYVFWWDYMDIYEHEDYVILKSKMENLIKLLNENDTLLLNKDIETEIWEMI